MQVKMKFFPADEIVIEGHSMLCNAFWSAEIDGIDGEGDTPNEAIADLFSICLELQIEPNPS